MKPEVKIMTVTPEKAKEWLTVNNNNRKPSEERITSLAKQIAEDKYILCPDAIAFDINNRLINGQHRLFACVKANKAIQSIVLINAPVDTFMITDTGMKKSGKHALDTLGYVKTSALSAAARIVANMIANGGPYEGWQTTRNVPPNEVVAAVEAYPDLGTYVAEGERLTNSHDKLNTTGTVLAVSLWYAAQHGCQEGLLAFLTKAANQIGLEEQSPALALRRRLANQTGGRTWMNNRDNMAWCLKAFILHREGKKCQTLVWKDSESFPSLNA